MVNFAISLLFVSPLGAEFLLDTTFLLSNQNNVSVAKGTNRILCVFEDDRDSVNSGIDIYGVWLDLNGNPLDMRAFPIVNDTLDQRQPRVAYGDGRFVVAWIYKKFSYLDYFGIGAREVFEDGTLGPVHIIKELDDSTYGSTRCISLVHNPEMFTLFWWEVNMGFSSYFLMRLSPSIDFIDTEPQLLMEGMMCEYNCPEGFINATAKGNSVGLVWNEYLLGAGMTWNSWDGLLKLEVDQSHWDILDSVWLQDCSCDHDPGCERHVPLIASGCDTLFTTWFIENDPACSLTLFKGNFNACIDYHPASDVGALDFDGERFFLLLNSDSLLYGLAINCDGSPHRVFPISDHPVFKEAVALPIEKGRQLVLWRTPFNPNGPDTVFRFIGEVVDVVNTEERGQFRRSYLSVDVSPTLGDGDFWIKVAPVLDGIISVTVVTAGGREVCQIYRGYAKERMVFNWDGRDSDGRLLPRGIYFVSVKTRDNMAVKKVVVVGRGK